LGGDLRIMDGDVFDVVERLRTEGHRFDLVVARAFLYHIPDYLALLRQFAVVLERHGQFISYADPLRYDTVPWRARRFSQASYYWWRLFQGNYGRGLRTLTRRAQQRLDENCPADMVEYHVVRNGVDQLAIRQLLEERGFAVRTITYHWSQSPLGNWLGQRLRLHNGFVISAVRPFAAGPAPGATQ
jgi:SAM-dependent methyltransferase